MSHELAWDRSQNTAMRDEAYGSQRSGKAWRLEYNFKVKLK